MATSSDLKTEPPAVRASRLKLEYSAVDETYCCWLGRSDPYGATEGEIEHSKAISLKRIADVLESANMDAFQNQLLDIAYKAGLNFRGQA